MTSMCALERLLHHLLHLFKRGSSGNTPLHVRYVGRVIMITSLDNDSVACFHLRLPFMRPDL